jgi:hypothetical protein
MSEYAAGLKLVVPSRRAPLSAGLRWVTEGWRLFMKAPLMWGLALLIFIVSSIVLSLVPILGQIAVQILTPVYLAGFAVACRSLETGGDFEVEHLMAGFKPQYFRPLAIVGALFLLGSIVIFLAFIGFAGFSILGAIWSGNKENIEAAVIGSALQLLLGSLIALALFLPLLAAYWFAPFLVIMHDMPPVAAMKASLVACFKNFFTYAVYGIVMIVIAIVAAIPIVIPILGWLVTFAAFVVLFVISLSGIYAAYRDIFTEDERPAQPTF